MRLEKEPGEKIKHLQNDNERTKDGEINRQNIIDKLLDRRKASFQTVKDNMQEKDQEGLNDSESKIIELNDGEKSKECYN